MKHRITAALERFSRAMLAPLSYLSAAGLLLVVGVLLTSAPLAGVLPFLRWEPVQLAGREPTYWYRVRSVTVRRHCRQRNNP